ncbi:uncharacterized protein MELLADRAFT_114114 [Melampsora larici-populina 98AG31]|uniref:Uncharacterized protein n=1 Tax=Melampsora larici-populina (strain 98AG31 / pathotype 3-4-7) TaxID=747676 RepID=F4SC79_MELLP|nr:uncharacterized protein MELLADRAFT_114114 [Melampsora larici-populina 98AG31]EGF97734.1 hypothetical protein MELLADRAFT_114114 [Melampsora larici-populina 98AG31]
MNSSDQLSSLPALQASTRTSTSLSKKPRDSPEHIDDTYLVNGQYDDGLNSPKTSSEDPNEPLRPDIDELEQSDNWIKLPTTSPILPFTTSDHSDTLDGAVDYSKDSIESQIDELDHTRPPENHAPLTRARSQALKRRISHSQALSPISIPPQIGSATGAQRVAKLPSCAVTKTLSHAPTRLTHASTSNFSRLFPAFKSATHSLHSYRSETRSPTHSPTHSSTRSSIHSPTRLFQSPTRLFRSPTPLFNSPPRALSQSSTRNLSQSPTHNRSRSPTGNLSHSPDSSGDSDLDSVETPVGARIKSSGKAKGKGKGKGKVSEYEWNCVGGPPGGRCSESSFKVDITSEPSEYVKRKAIGVIEKRIPAMAKYLFDHQPLRDLNWVGLDYTPKNISEAYDIDTNSGWNEFLDAAKNLKRHHSLGILVRMPNPGILEKEKDELQLQINQLNALTSRQAEDLLPKPKKELPSLDSPNLHSGTIDCLMAQYQGGRGSGSESMRYIDPLDSTKWVRLNNIKLRMWADELTEAQRAGQTDVTIFIPPKTPAFRTYLGGREPSAIRALHEAHPAYGPSTQAISPVELNPVQSTSAPVPAINNIQQNTPTSSSSLRFQSQTLLRASFWQA